MTKVPGPADYRESLHRGVVETARAVIAGTLGPVDAARRFVGMAAELDALDEEAFRFFLGLDSESDQFPLGTFRNLWRVDALKREDDARKEYEAHVRDEAVRHCQSLVAKYAAGGGQ